MMRIPSLSRFASRGQSLPRGLRLAATLLIACLGAGTARAGSTAIVHTPDVDLAYETQGQDSILPPVVAVNGGPGLTHAYMVQNDLWTRLSAHRKVVFYDQRGNGRSTRVAPGAPQTLDAQVADLDAVRTALHAEKIDLVGDSFGGLIVLAYTLAHPEHVSHLVVSDGLPGWKAIVHPLPDVFPDLDAQEESASKEAPDSKAAQDRGFRVHIRECFYSLEKAERYLSNFDDLGLDAGVNRKVSVATQSVDLTSQLHDIKVPTLILTGRFDMNVAPITAWRMAHTIPGARLHIFEHSGHLPSYEEPEQYLGVLTDFLSHN